MNARFANALSNNRNRDFWKEVKRIRSKTSNVSGVVDGSLGVQTIDKNNSHSLRKD